VILKRFFSALVHIAECRPPQGSKRFGVSVAVSTVTAEWHPQMPFRIKSRKPNTGGKRITDRMAGYLPVKAKWLSKLWQQKSAIWIKNGCFFLRQYPIVSLAKVRKRRWSVVIWNKNGISAHFMARTRPHHQIRPLRHRPPLSQRPDNGYQAGFAPQFPRCKISKKPPKSLHQTAYFCWHNLG